MAMDVSRYQGCLLGLAVGDAMGYTVDGKTLAQIQEAYGPNGLLGYDLANGSAEVSSYTQLAAYCANGLLIGITRGKNVHYTRFFSVALTEWARSQMYYRDPEHTWCWIAKLPQLRSRHCRDSRMLDVLRSKILGAPESNIRNNLSPGALTEAVAIGMSFQPQRMEPSFLGELSARGIGTTHESPEAFLPGVVLAYAIAGILQEPELPLHLHFSHATSAMQAQFRDKHPQADELAQLLNHTIALASDPDRSPEETMESLHCSNSDRCLAGAMYACLVCEEDFDRCMILAVNHSGRSAAVGAVAGALLGAHLGCDALPEFYLESLPIRSVLMELAADMTMGTPTMGLFDDDWDHKYTQGLPPEK